MKKTMKKLNSIVLALAILVSGFTMGMDVSAATSIQTKMAAKPTKMSGTLVWSLKGSSNIPGLTQGSCVAGDYLYVGYTSTSDSDVTTGLRKYKFSDGTIVKTTTPDLGHVNDMTYNSTLGKLVIAHCSPIGNMVSIANTDTLAIEQTYYISKFIYGIEYIASSDTYVVGMAGTESLVILDSNFVPVNCDQTQYTQPSTIGGVSKEDDGCMPQAINCDGTYVYATWFISASATGNSTGANKNIIVVYDMTGNKITEILSDLTSGKELEGLIVQDSYIYGVYGNPGDPQTYLYKYTTSNFS